MKEIRDKEQIVNLKAVVIKGKELYVCPRCGHRYNNNLLGIRYCAGCGQHIAPFMYQLEEEDIRKHVVTKLTIEDLKK